MPRALLYTALLASINAARASTHAEEEAAMSRMLSLAQKSLVSDRPLPVRPLGGAAATTTAAEQNGTCAASIDGHPIGVSPWAHRFAAKEQNDGAAAQRPTKEK